jgi:hypothetical protein
VAVPGLTRIPIPDEAAVDAVLARAAKRRSVAATSMNAQSSRSHAVFTLHLRGEHRGRGVALRGALHLVDLAGSERLDRSGAEGDRKRETAAINKSLSCLADVFTALGRKAPHIPFRNSRLTTLLAPCFRGDGKTLMLVNVSPTEASAFETLCSLRFAATVAQVELGRTRKRTAEALPSAPAGAAGGGAAAAAAPPPPSSASIEDGETEGAPLDIDALVAEGGMDDLLDGEEGGEDGEGEGGGAAGAAADAAANKQHGGGAAAAATARPATLQPRANLATSAAAAAHAGMKRTASAAAIAPRASVAPAPLRRPFAPAASLSASAVAATSASAAAAKKPRLTFAGGR